MSSYSVMARDPQLGVFREERGRNGLVGAVRSEENICSTLAQWHEVLGEKTEHLKKLLRKQW